MNRVPLNSLATRLRDGQTAIGTMITEVRQPSIAQVLANAGFDFVIIDGEHGQFTIETMADLSQACLRCGMTPIVRVADITCPEITRPLDGGAQGIMIPRVRSAREARDAVEMMKYPPAGRRGAVMGRAATRFKSGSLVEIMAESNAQTMLIVQIETVEALSSIDELLAVPGIDVALIGPTDLSTAMGIPGQFNDDRFRQAISRTISACKTHGIVPGIHSNDLSLAVSWMKQGMKLVSIQSEIGFMLGAATESVRSLRTS